MLFVWMCVEASKIGIEQRINIVDFQLLGKHKPITIGSILIILGV